VHANVHARHANVHLRVGMQRVCQRVCQPVLAIDANLSVQACGSDRPTRSPALTGSGRCFKSKGRVEPMIDILTEVENRTDPTLRRPMVGPIRPKPARPLWVGVNIMNNAQNCLFSCQNTTQEAVYVKTGSTILRYNSFHITRDVTRKATLCDRKD
jgi:hypothetical protein